MIDIKRADRLDLEVEKLNSDGGGRLPGVHIEQAAANGKLTAFGHDWHAIVSGLLQRGPEFFQLVGGASLDFQLAGEQQRHLWHILVEAVRHHHHHWSNALIIRRRSRQPMENGQPLGNQLRIGQQFLSRRRRLHLRKKTHSFHPQPRRQIMMHVFLCPKVTHHQPRPGRTHRRRLQ